MHELSISSAIVDTATRHAAGRRVTSVDARIGALRQVVPESLGFYFGIVARDTICDGAELRQELVGATLGCRTCGQLWDPRPEPIDHDPVVLPSFRCPACWSAAADVLTGNELEVESIEVEDPDEPAPAEPGEGEPLTTKAEV